MDRQDPQFTLPFNPDVVAITPSDQRDPLTHPWMYR